MKRLSILCLLTASLFFSNAFAQDLAKLLPTDTFFALGIQDWISYQDKLQPYIDEFQRLELGKALMALGDSSNDSSNTGEDGQSDTPITDAAKDNKDVLKQWQERFGDTNMLDLFGTEAWIGVSAATSSPLPTLTLLTKLKADAVGKFQQVFDEENPKQNAETMTEGDASFYVITDTSSEPPFTIAYSLQDDLLVLSTSSDVLRSVLRQLSGSSEANFTASQGYETAIGQYGTANAYGYFDFGKVADIGAPFAKALGFDALIERLVQALNTAGTSGGVMRFTDDGAESQGFQAVNPEGGDTSLLALLTGEAVADRAALDKVPADALSASVNHADLSAWWNYLNEIAATQPEFGGDLDAILQSFGVDLRTTFFNWVGTQVTTITTGIAESLEPGMPASNLLGETVYVFETSDEAAAQQGISTLIETISTQVSAFADPSGGTGNAEQSTEDIAGATVTTLDITSGVSLSYAVQGGKAILATSKDGLRKVLEAQDNITSLEAVQGLLEFVPENASGFAISNNQATLQGSAGQIRSSIQTAAGLGGSSGLNFEATDLAAGKFEEFLTFIAERMGYSVSYSQHEAAGIRSFGKSEVSW
jgi:hypothetical protein